MAKEVRCVRTVRNRRHIDRSEERSAAALPNERMSSRERVLAAMRRRPVDHVPCAPFMNAQDASQRMGRRWQYPFGPSVPETLEYMVGTLGVDQIVSLSWEHFPEPGVSSRVWMEGDTIHKNVQTPSGRLAAAVRYDANWPHGLDIPFFSDYNPSHFIEPWLKSMADVACMRHILLPPKSRDELEQIRFSHRVAKDLAGRYGLATCFSFGSGLTGALQVFGPSEVCLLAAAEPGLIDAYLALDHAWTMANYEIALDLGVDIVRRNGFYESSDFYSPSMLQSFLAQRLREEVSIVHQAGTVIGYTLLTGYVPMLDYLSKLDLDCIMCPDVFMKGGDAAALNRALGGRTSFWTGPSDTIHMPWDRPEEVRAAVRHVFAAFGRTGLLITPCSSSKAVFPWGNVLAMVDEWKKLR